MTPNIPCDGLCKRPATQTLTFTVSDKEYRRHYCEQCYATIAPQVQRFEKVYTGLKEIAAIAQEEGMYD